MLSKENKVGAQFKNGSRLDYSDSRKWDNVIVVALEDLENSDNLSLNELIMDIVNEKRFGSLTGGIREALPYEKSELENPRLPNMTNKEKNDRLVSHKKKAAMKDEFWNNEFESLRSNIQDEYNQLKEKIIKGRVRVKPSSSIKSSKKTIIIKLISSVMPNIKRNKSSVMPVEESNIPVANEIHNTHAEYVSKKLGEYHKKAILEAEKSSVDVVFSSPSRGLSNSFKNKKSILAR